MIEPHKIFGRLGNQMFQGAYIYSQFRKGLTPDLYVQDYSLFKDYDKEIKELFGDGIGYLDQVAIHVRRGDYVDNPFYVDLSKTEYYDSAVKLFPEDNFLVFSDDPDFCKTLFAGKRFQIMTGGTELEDLNMMASCKSQIIANSSYSWWAAFINPNPTKKVIAPKEWFSDKFDRVTIPPEWIRI